MSVHRPHLVTEAQRNTLDHVLDVTTDRADGSQLLSVSPPFVNSEPLLLLAKETEFHVDVIEVPPEGSPGALHNNCASLQSDVDIFRNVDGLIAENGLHSETQTPGVSGPAQDLFSTKRPCTERHSYRPGSRNPGEEAGGPTRRAAPGASRPGRSSSLTVS